MTLLKLAIAEDLDQSVDPSTVGQRTTHFALLARRRNRLGRGLFVAGVAGRAHARRTRRPRGGTIAFGGALTTAIWATVAPTIATAIIAVAPVSAVTTISAAIKPIAAALPTRAFFLDDRLRLDLLHLVLIQVPCVGDHHAQHVF